MLSPSVGGSFTCVILHSVLSPFVGGYFTCVILHSVLSPSVGGYFTCVILHSVLSPSVGGYFTPTTMGRNFWYVTNLTHNSFIQSSTCFKQTRAHHQEVSCINTSSGIVPLCQWPSGLSLTEGDYTRSCINTIDLLMMSTCLLETCRGLK